MPLSTPTLDCLPQVGQASPVNRIGGAALFNAGAGACTLSTLASENVWLFSGGDKSGADALSLSYVTSVNEQGATFVFRIARPVLSTSGTNQTTIGLFTSGLTTTQALRLLWVNSSGNTMNESWDGGSTPTSSVLDGGSGLLTVVVRIKQDTADGMDRINSWVQTTGRVGTAPDRISPTGQNKTARTFTTVMVQALNGSQLALGRLVGYNEALSDADCAALADGVNTVLAVDTTPPALTSATATGGVLLGSGSVSTDEANGSLYAVVTASATAPTAVQVEAGQDHTGAAALRAVGPQTVSGTGVQNIASGAISAGTRYWHYMHKDALGNRSTVVSSGSFVVEATAPAPVLSSPTAGSPGTTTITIGATSDRASDGTMRFLRRVGGSAASAATIASTGESQAAGANPQSRGMSGFTASSTNNYVDMVQVGAGGNSNVVTAGPFTMATPSVSVTTDVLKDKDGATRTGFTASKVYAVRLSDDALVKVWTDVSTNGSGQLVLGDAALTPVPHLICTYTAGGTPLAGAKVYTPS